MTSPAETTDSTAGFSIKRVAMVAIPLAIAAGIIIPMAASRIEQNAEKRAQEVMLNWFNMTSPTPRRLDPRFTDADQDLVADVLADPGKQIAPDELLFAYVAGPNAETEMPAWQGLADYLAERTGTPVKLTSYPTTRAQLAALAAGELHVTAFNTGAVPSAVASCGFVPVSTLGRNDGSFGTTMCIIVPAKSKAKAIKDLKGGTIAFTTRDSNSGCKAALALLREHDLLPLRDYLWKFSGGHDESITGVAKGAYPAASVAGDLLERAKSNGLVSEDQIRTIYESERFPPATLGHLCYLAPELSEKIRTALIEFKPEGTSTEEPLRASGVTKFVPISYKQDFALIRRIDDAFREPGRSASD